MHAQIIVGIQMLCELFYPQKKASDIVIHLLQPLVQPTHNSFSF